MAKASAKTVVTALKRTYMLTEEAAWRLVNQYSALVSTGERMASNADYVAREIMQESRGGYE